MARRIIFIFLFISLGCFRYAFGDTEFWSVNTFQYPIRERVKLNLIPELRFRDNLAELYYFQTYIGPQLSLSKTFDLNFYYAVNLSKNGSAWASPKSLGYLDAIFKYQFPWFYFNERTRFEYDISSDTLKIRNFYQFKIGSWCAGDELFYNFKKGFNDEGRATVGYSTKIIGDLDLTLRYMLRRQKQNSTDDWSRTNVINVDIKIIL